MAVNAAFGQTDFKDILTQSDSIRIISHSDLSVTINKPGKSETISHDVLVDGKPNPAIVKEQFTLAATAKNDLIYLLLNQKATPGYDEAYCFEPHHTILIYNGKECHAIYICFGCRHVTASPALGLTGSENFLHSNEDWEKMEGFFRKQGITYKMPEW